MVRGSKVFLSKYHVLLKWRRDRDLNPSGTCAPPLISNQGRLAAPASLRKRRHNNVKPVRRQASMLFRVVVQF